MDLSFPYHRWNFRSLEHSFPGTFAPESESYMELSLPGTFAPGNFRFLKLSFPETFTPCNNMYRSLELHRTNTIKETYNRRSQHKRM